MPSASGDLDNIGMQEDVFVEEVYDEKLQEDIHNNNYHPHSPLTILSIMEKIE
jgi:hypothetical protein